MALSLSCHREHHRKHCVFGRDRLGWGSLVLASAGTLRLAPSVAALFSLRRSRATFRQAFWLGDQHDPSGNLTNSSARPGRRCSSARICVQYLRAFARCGNASAVWPYRRRHCCSLHQYGAAIIPARRPGPDGAHSVVQRQFEHERKDVCLTAVR